MAHVMSTLKLTLFLENVWLLLSHQGKWVNHLVWGLISLPEAQVRMTVIPPTWRWYSSISLGKYPGVELLYHMVILHLIFWGTSILFSTVAAPVCIPTKSSWGFLFTPHLLFSSLFFFLFFSSIVDTQWYIGFRCPPAIWQVYTSCNTHHKCNCSLAPYMLLQYHRLYPQCQTFHPCDLSIP